MLLAECVKVKQFGMTYLAAKGAGLGTGCLSCI